MSQVLLFASTPIANSASTGDNDAGATALLPVDGSTVIESLIGTLRALPACGVEVVARPAIAPALRERGITVIESADVVSDLAVVAARAKEGTGPLVLASADLVTHRAVLDRFAGVRATRTQAAVSVDPGADRTAQPIMRQRDQVISVATHEHEVTDPNATFRGLLTVSGADRAALVDVCDALTAYGPTVPGGLDRVAGDYGTIGMVLLGLVRADVKVPAYHVRFLHITRVGDADAAKSAYAGLATVDETKARLSASKKEDEEFLATYLVQTYTPWIVRFCARRGITPNAITWTSVVIAFGAVAAFASANRGLWVLGGVLLYVSFIFDCCDGGIARFTGHSSRYGGWFDMISDRIKEYAVYAGLAVGGVRAGQKGVWALALAAMVVMTVRHMIDSWYGAMQETATRSLAAVPLDSPLDRLGIRAAASSARAASADDGAAERMGATLGRLSAQAHGDYRSARYWLKRSVVLPIGDRWLILAIAAAAGGPQIAFIVLLAFMTLAFAYIYAGRTLRALAMKIAVMPRFNIADQRDDGVIARVLARTGIARLSPVTLPLPGLALGIAALCVVGTSLHHSGPLHDWKPLATVIVGAVGLAALLGAGAPHDRPLDWQTPAALRAFEYVFILVAGYYGGVPQPLIYGLIFTITLLHYELVSRTEKAATPLRVTRTALGWDVRVVLIGIAAMAGYTQVGFWVVLAAVGLTLLIGWTTGLVRR